MPIGALSVSALVLDDMYKELLVRGALNRPDTSILDCGIGYGIYGPMIRQWCDQGYVRNFKTYIMGIEGFSGYKNCCWEAYNQVHVTTIQFYLEWPNSVKDEFNVILLMDVIEHFTKEEGLVVLKKLKAKLKTRGVFYVATPGILNEQGAAYGNELETHKYGWTSEEFKALGFELICNGKTPDFLGNVMIVAKYIAL